MEPIDQRPTEANPVDGSGRSQGVEFAERPVRGEGARRGSSKTSPARFARGDDCDNLGTLEVVVFSNGPASPGLVVDSNQVVIPYKLHVEGTFTPTGGEPESFVDEFEKPGPRNGRLDHCTFHQEGTDEFGSFELDGEVWVSYMPAH